MLSKIVDSVKEHPILTAAAGLAVGGAVFYLLRQSKSSAASEGQRPNNRTLERLSRTEFAGESKKVRLGNRRESVAGESYDPTTSTERIRIVNEKSAEDAQLIHGYLKKLLLFRHLDSPQLSQVVDAVAKRTVAKGEFLIKQGDEGDEFYIVASGQFEVIKDGESKTKYSAGQGFGELALLYMQPRAASVVALEDSTVWAVDRDTFRQSVVRSMYDRRVKYAEFLKKVPLFEELSEMEIIRLSDVLGREEFEAGQAIVKEGEQGDLFFIIEDGTVVVSQRDAEGNDKIVERLVAGQFFGEVALLRDGVRAATVVAESAVTCLVIDKPSFLRLLGPCLDPLQRKIDAYSRA